MAMMTTEKLFQAHQSTRDPNVVAAEVNPDLLTVEYKGANHYAVHTEAFRSMEEAGDYLRKLRQIAHKKGLHKHE